MTGKKNQQRSTERDQDKQERKKRLSKLDEVAKWARTNTLPVTSYFQVTSNNANSSSNNDRINSATESINTMNNSINETWNTSEATIATDDYTIEMNLSNISTNLDLNDEEIEEEVYESGINYESGPLFEYIKCIHNRLRIEFSRNLSSFNEKWLLNILKRNNFWIKTLEAKKICQKFHIIYS